MAETQQVVENFATRIRVMSDGNTGAATIIMNWLQYMLEQNQSVDLMNMLVMKLPFTGEELYSFFAYGCNGDMETFHNRIYGKVMLSRR